MNRLRQRLQEGKPLVGGGITLHDLRITEMLGQVYDFLWIDMEHTGTSVETVAGHLIAAKAVGCPAVVRLAWNDAVLAKPILDLGAEGVVFPQVDGLEGAKKALAACMYPPEGERGWGPIRAQNYGMTDSGVYCQQVHEQVFPILQLENLAFFRDLDQILALEGLGAICVGPCDLSGALGMLCQLQADKLQTMLDTIGEKTKRSRIPLMVSMGYDILALEQWIGRGADMIQLSSDYALMLQHAKQEVKSFRERIRR